MSKQNIYTNQDFQKNKIIDPALNPKTTVQRLAMNSTMTVNDESVVVWDSDLNAFFVWESSIMDWLPFYPKQRLYLPTPKVYVPANGKSNVPSSTDPDTVVNLDPTNANKPIKIRLYYEGNDNVQDWQNLPELRYELIRLKPYRGRHSSQLQKRTTGYSFVHPSHNDGVASDGTNYSGGKQKDANGNIITRTTEWAVDKTSNKGATQIVGNNPFTEIEIDPKQWFYRASNGVTSFGNNVLPMRYLEAIDSNDLRLSGQKGNNRYHDIQNFMFCFRITAGDPISYDATKNIYKKRLMSDYSEIFEIYPHCGIFEYGGLGVSGDLERVLYEWRVRPV